MISESLLAKMKGLEPGSQATAPAPAQESAKPLTFAQKILLRKQQEEAAKNVAVTVGGDSGADSTPAAAPEAVAIQDGSVVPEADKTPQGLPSASAEPDITPAPTASKPSLKDLLAKAKSPASAPAEQPIESLIQKTLDAAEAKKQEAKAAATNVADLANVRLDDISSSKFNHSTQPKAFANPQSIDEALRFIYESFDGQTIVEGVSADMIGSTLEFLMIEARQNPELMKVLEAEPKNMGIMVRAMRALTGNRQVALAAKKSTRAAAKAGKQADMGLMEDLGSLLD